MTDIPNKRFFLSHELANEMGVSIETVRRWLRENRIVHTHLPGKQLISRDEYIRTLKYGPRPRTM